jgi:hypothetical protein
MSSRAFGRNVAPYLWAALTVLGLIAFTDSAAAQNREPDGLCEWQGAYCDVGRPYRVGGQCTCAPANCSPRNWSCGFYTSGWRCTCRQSSRNHNYSNNEPGSPTYCYHHPYEWGCPGAQPIDTGGSGSCNAQRCPDGTTPVMSGLNGQCECPGRSFPPSSRLSAKRQPSKRR